MDGVRHAVRASWTMMLVAGSVDAPARAGDDDPARRGTRRHVVGRSGRRGRPAVRASTPPTSCWSATARRPRWASSAGSQIWISDVQGNGRAVRLDGRRRRAYPRRARPRAQRLSAGLGQPDVPRLRPGGLVRTATTSCGRRTASACSSTAVTPTSSSTSSSTGCPAACSTPRRPSTPSCSIPLGRRRATNRGPGPASPWLRRWLERSWSPRQWPASPVASPTTAPCCTPSAPPAATSSCRPSLRWAVTAALAAAVSVVAVAAASTLGPIGIGRRGPWTRGVTIDPVVLAVGVPAVFAIVIAAGVLPTMRRAARTPLGIAVSVPGPPSVGRGDVARFARRPARRRRADPLRRRCHRRRRGRARRRRLRSVDDP